MTAKEMTLLKNIDDSLAMLNETSMSMFYYSLEIDEDAYKSILETIKELKKIKNALLARTKGN